MNKRKAGIAAVLSALMILLIPFNAYADVESAANLTELAKIVNENGGWSSKMIPRLLSSVYHELICEEMWNVLKAFKNPTINFRALNNFVIAKIKQVKPEIFG